MEDGAQVVIVPEAAMAVGGATVRLLGLPVVVSADGLRRVTPATRASLTDRVARDLTLADVSRFRGRVRCGVCGGELVRPGRRSEQPIPAPTEDGVVTVLVEATFARCGDCSADHLDPDVGLDRVLAALDAALTSATDP